MRVLGVYAEPELAEHVPLDPDQIRLDVFVPLAEVLEMRQRFLLPSPGHPVKHVDDVAELPRALLELAREEHRGGGDPPHVELDHGSLGVEAVEEDLAGARHLLRRLEEHRRLLDELASVDAHGELVLFAHAPLSARRVYDPVVRNIKIVHVRDDHGVPRANGAPRVLPGRRQFSVRASPVVCFDNSYFNFVTDTRVKILQLANLRNREANVNHEKSIG